MDIAKYIGLYLLKNNFCYIHGLGNLELKKRPATYSDGALNAPSYEVILSLTGSIDDNLANFIATNEQISISKAANALRDFTTQARTDLQAGNEVMIPSIGKFVEVDGKIRFITEPKLQYTPPSIPTIKTAPRVSATQEKSNYEKANFEYAPRSGYEKESKPINWSRVIMLTVIILVIVAAIILGMNYMQTSNVTKTEPEPQQAKDTVITTEPLISDSTLAIEQAAQNASSGPAITEKDGILHFRVIVNEYTDTSSANKRLRQLIGYGHNAEMITTAQGKYAILLPVSAAAADTAKELNMYKANYNPKGVSIYYP